MSDSEFDSDVEQQSPHRRFHADGVHSTVYREQTGERWIATKVVSFQSNQSIKPHDIRREASIIAKLSHANIIHIESFTTDDDLQQFELRMPLIPLSLSDVLNSPHFSPLSAPSDVFLPPPQVSFNIPSLSRPATFELFSKSIIFQLITAVQYLHGLDPPIAHRDIKPGNVLLTATGCVKLIDFGIAWANDIPARPKNLGPKSPYAQGEEYADYMCPQVGSGAYRSIELMFSPPVYDACATDLWSLGVTISSFFTPLRLERRISWQDDFDDDLDDGDSMDEKDDLTKNGGKALPFIIPDTVIPPRSAVWSRETLFNNSRGELGLIWSIFSVFGTPTDESWPGMKALPGARMMAFQSKPPANLASLLPHLPSTPSFSSLLDLISALVAYNPASRLSASAALMHPWFITNDINDSIPILLPAERPLITAPASTVPANYNIRTEYNGFDLSSFVRAGVEQHMSEW